MAISPKMTRGIGAFAFGRDRASRVTSAPADRRAAVSGLPMKPVPPVTSTFAPFRAERTAAIAGVAGVSALSAVVFGPFNRVFLQMDCGVDLDGRWPDTARIGQAVEDLDRKWAPWSVCRWRARRANG